MKDSYACSVQKSKDQIFRLYVAFVPIEYSVCVFDFSRSSQRCHCFFPTQTSVASFFKQYNYWPVSDT